MSAHCTCETAGKDNCPEHKKKQRQFARGFKNITAVPADVARSIDQQVRIFMEADDPKEFQEYVQRARMFHAMIEDFKARTSDDADERKKAAETFLKLTDALTKRPPKAKK